MVEHLPEDDETAAAALRSWVLEGYRDRGVSDEIIATYDVNTFWPMQVAGIRRWLAAGRG